MGLGGSPPLSQTMYAPQFDALKAVYRPGTSSSLTVALVYGEEVAGCCSLSEQDLEQLLGKRGPSDLMVDHRIHGGSWSRARPAARPIRLRPALSGLADRRLPRSRIDRDSRSTHSLGAEELAEL